MAINLKSIYSSSDNYTVLSLIKALIDAIEDGEIYVDIESISTAEINEICQ